MACSMADTMSWRAEQPRFAAASRSRLWSSGGRSTLVLTLLGLTAPVSQSDLIKSKRLIQPLPESHRAQRQDGHAENRQRHHLRPQHFYSAALQKQTAHDVDEIPHWIQQR